MNNKKYLLLLIILLSIISCRKEKIEDTIAIDPLDEKYPVNYRFINTTEKKLSALNFTTATFFPNKYSTLLSYTHFPNVAAFDTITKANGLMDDYDNRGYIGCTTQMEINVYQDINDTLGYISTWVTRKETIRSKTDAEIFFYWPTDTLFSHKKLGIYYDLDTRTSIKAKDFLDHQIRGNLDLESKALISK